MIATFIIIALLALCIGSFLNVVICRYPKMLYRNWNKECQEFLDKTTLKIPAHYNLALPRSHCPHCKTTLTFWQNIPLLSFLSLRGKCAYCKAKISFQYPIVELITVVAILLITIKFGITLKTGALSILTLGLITLSFIDFNEHILPDSITISLLWLGLIVNAPMIQPMFTPPVNAIYSAAFGYLFLWAIAKFYLVTRKREGMGHGDFKMLALFGAWLGFTPMINIILLATLLAIIFSITALASKKMTRNTPIPFGPFLAIAGWITAVYGATIVNLVALHTQGF